ncbi:MAG TPA: hypothetical protein DC047_01185, partial [Blastocatellia bacterium]|nr:hypothetical protein [Blastocatellia bacterium]
MPFSGAPKVNIPPVRPQSVRFSTLNRISKRSRLAIALALVAIAASAAVASASSASFRALLFGRAVADITVANSGSIKQSSATPTALAPPVADTQLNKARRGHTATLLADGSVLVSGGEDANGFITEAEIYDPTSGTFSVSGNLSAPRADHTATRLPDGRVLIAGGRGQLGPLSSTEVFDPASGAFTAGPDLNGARSGHSATRLSDGRIVFAGGDASGSVEIYDPSANAFSSVGANMLAPRAQHSAALLNDGNILFVGGKALDGRNVLTGEILNVASAAFSAVGNEAKDEHVRALLRVLPDGKVQIIGGTDHEDIEMYDPAINQFGAHAHVYPIGDSHPALYQEILDAPTRTALFRHGASSALLNRDGETITELSGSTQALVIGGTDGSGAFLNSAATLNSSAATVTTDKLDYAPGTPVIVSGTGWQPNEVVTLMFHEDPHVGTENPHTFLVQTDADGNFVHQQYAPEDQDNGLTYILAATGGTSGRTAQTALTDANTTYFSTTSGDANTLSNWKTNRNGTGTSPANFTTSGDVFIIQGSGGLSGAPHAMTTSAAWAITGSTAKLQIESGASLTGNNLITFNTSGSNKGTFQVDNGATYVHNAVGSSSNGSQNDFPGVASNLSLGASSTVEIQKWASGGGTPAALPGVSWGNLKINVASLGGSWQQSAALTTVNGNLTIVATGSGANEFRLNSNTPATFTTTIGSDLIITGGTLNIVSGTSVGTLNIGGNFNQSGGTFTASSGGPHAVNFTGSSKTFTQSAGTLTNTNINWTVNNGASLTLANNLGIATSRSLTVTGTLSGGTNAITGAGLVTVGGTLTTSGTNTYTGTTTINIGGTVQLGSGGTTGSLSTSSTITNNGNLTISRSNAVSQGIDFSTGAIIGSGSLTKAGTGTLTLNNINTYSGGTTISAGTILWNNNSALGTGPVTINDPSTGTNNTSLYRDNSNGQLTVNITVANQGSGTTTIGNDTGATTLGYSGTLTLNKSVTLKGGASGGSASFTGLISGGGGVTTAPAAGIVIVANSGNSYSGDTIISAGSTLGIGSGAIPDGSGKGNVSVAGTLDLRANSETINGLSGSGTVDNTVNAAIYALTVGNNDQTSTFSGVIKNTTGTVALTKTGTGTLTLSGGNTYGGATTLSGGTLSCGTANTLPSTSQIILNGGALSTGATSGFTQSTGTLNLSDNSTIALGTGSHSLTFAASNGVSWTSAKTLTVTGWTGTNGSSGTGGKIFVGPTSSGLTTGQLAQITFLISSVSYPATILSTGEVVPAATDVSVGVSPVSVAEDGAPNMVYTFTRSSVAGGALTVNFSVGGTAAFSTDYAQSGAATFTASTGTVTFGAGNLTTTVTVDPTVDTTYEDNETAVLTLTSGTGYNVGTLSAATGTITNDDALPSFSIDDVTHNEGNSGTTTYTFTVTKSGTTALNATVDYQTQDGSATTADSDYTGIGTATLTFLPGDTTKQITVNVNGDTHVEPTENFLVNLSNPNTATISDNQGQGTITNDDTSGTYLWNGSTGTLWTNPLNWTPTRIVPTVGDIMIFDGGSTSTATVTGIPTETIKGLHFQNAVNATFNADAIVPGTKTLTVSGAGGDLLVSGATTKLTVATTTPLIISVASTATGSVAGQITFKDGAHQLIAAGSGSTVTFTSANAFTTDLSYDGSTHPFGAGTGGNNDSIIFATGSVYTHGNGLSPFGSSLNRVVKFNTGSEADYWTNTGFNANGRTYANLVIGKGDPSGIAVTATDPCSTPTNTCNGDFQFDNLAINSTGSLTSSLTYLGTGSSKVTIQGNITSVAAGSGGNAPDLLLGGGSSGPGIVINKPGGGTVTFGNFVNSRGIDFESDATVDSATTLNLARLLQTGFAGGKVLTVNGTLIANYLAQPGYVIGNLRKNYGVGSNVSQTFEVGTVSYYDPISVTFGSVSTGGTVTATAKSGDISDVNNPVDTNKSVEANWKLTNGGVVFTAYGATINYLAAQIDGGANAANFIVGKRDSGVWTRPTISGTPTTTSITATGMTSMSDFAVGEVACTAPAVTTNPSAVSITYGGDAIFTAAASGNPTPTVQWQADTGSGFSNLSDGGNVSGSTTTTLTITRPTVSQSGTQYRAVFTNTCVGPQTATTTAATLTVLAKSLTATITADNKTYDGTTAATIYVSLAGVISPDIVTPVGTGTFDNANAGTGKTVTSSDIAIGGADAGNYLVNSSATTTANITQAGSTTTIDCSPGSFT